MIGPWCPNGSVNKKGCAVMRKLTATAAAREFILILLTEAVTDWEEVPATLLIHVPDVRFLTGVLCVRFVNQMHKEEHVVRQIVLLLDMRVEAMRHYIEKVFAHATYETVRLHVLLHRFQLITKLTECVDDQTLNDGQKDNNDKEEEGYVENDAIDFIFVADGVANFVTYTTTCSHTLVQMEYKAG